MIGLCRACASGAPEDCQRLGACTPPEPTEYEYDDLETPA